MNINKIRLYNFGAYAGEHIIEPANDRTGQKILTIIGGMNGRGKTSILDAVLIALYGSHSLVERKNNKSYSQYLESLINNNISRNIGASVELDFDVVNENEKVNLRIKRSWKLANIRTVDYLETWRNGQADPYLAENWESYVEELIPSGLAGLFFFDGEKISDLAEAEDTPIAIQNAIRSMLGFDVIDRLIVDLNTISRRNSNKINDPKIQTEYTELQDKRELLVLKENQLTQEIAQITANLERTNNILRTKQEEFNNIGGSLATRRSEMLASFESLKDDHNEIKSEIINLIGGTLPLSLVLPLLNNISVRTLEEEENKKARLALTILNHRNEQLREYFKSSSSNSEIIQQIDQILTNQENDLKAKAFNEPILNLSSVAQAHINSFINDSYLNLLVKAQELLNTENQIKTKKENLERLLQFETDQEDISERLKEFSNLNQQIANLTSNKELLEKNLVSIKNEIRSHENQLNKIISQLQKAEESERIVHYSGYSQQVLREFRDRLTKSKITLLSQKIEEAFKFLSNKENLIDSIKINPDSLKISLYNNKGQEIIKARLSSGERQMLAISILWGLAQSSGKRIPIIIDTPMGRLDSSHRMHFVSRYLPNASHQVIVLSTDTEIVGSYLNELEQFIGKKYLLSFDNKLNQTKIIDGYFSIAEAMSQ